MGRYITHLYTGQYAAYFARSAFGKLPYLVKLAFSNLTVGEKKAKSFSSYLPRIVKKRYLKSEIAEFEAEFEQKKAEGSRGLSIFLAVQEATKERKEGEVTRREKELLGSFQ